MAGRKTKYRRTEQVGIRLTPDDAAVVARAVEIESRRLGERVPAATLMRRLAMREIREMVEKAEEVAA